MILELVIPLTVFSVAISMSAYRWVMHKIETATDEREERQAADRAEQRHRHRLDRIEKFETAAAIVVADKAMADTLRAKIDAEFPRARVELDEEEQEDEEEPRARRSRRRKRR